MPRGLCHTDMGVHQLGCVCMPCWPGGGLCSQAGLPLPAVARTGKHAQALSLPALAAEAMRLRLVQCLCMLACPCHAWQRQARLTAGHTGPLEQQLGAHKELAAPGAHLQVCWPGHAVPFWAGDAPLKGLLLQVRCRQARRTREGAASGRGAPLSCRLAPSSTAACSCIWMGATTWPRTVRKVSQALCQAANLVTVCLKCQRLLGNRSIHKHRPARTSQAPGKHGARTNRISIFAMHHGQRAKLLTALQRKKEQLQPGNSAGRQFQRSCIELQPRSSAGRQLRCRRSELKPEGSTGCHRSDCQKWCTQGGAAARDTCWSAS